MFLCLTRYYLLLGSYNENSQLLHFDSLFEEFNLQICYSRKIGENRFWELRYLILSKIPENKLTEKRPLGNETLYLINKIRKKEKKNFLYNRNINKKRNYFELL